MTYCKVSVVYIPINSGGYTSTGEYRGLGGRLYRYSSEDQEIYGEVRAENRHEACEHVRSQYPKEALLFQPNHHDHD